MLGPGPDTSNKTTTGQSTIFAITAAGPGTSSTQRSAKTAYGDFSPGPEPDDGKPSRPVLRGPAPSNGGRLLGSSVTAMFRRN
jgi:hypothetical protein